MGLRNNLPLGAATTIWGFSFTVVIAVLTTLQRSNTFLIFQAHDSLTVWKHPPLLSLCVDPLGDVEELMVFVAVPKDSLGQGKRLDSPYVTQYISGPSQLGSGWPR